MKKLLTILLALCLVGGLTPSLAFANPGGGDGSVATPTTIDGDDLEYNYDSATHTATVTGLNTSIKSNTSIVSIALTIPATVSKDEVEYQVTAIDEYAFDAYNVTGHTKYNAANEKITSVTFAENSNIQTIGQYAFANCQKIEKISIPASVITMGRACFFQSNSTFEFANDSKLETIGKSAFQACTFETIVLPATVTAVKDGAFYNCKNLKSVTFKGAIPNPNADDRSFLYSWFAECTDLTEINAVGESSEGYYTEGGVVFKRTDDGIILIKCPEAKEGTYTVPSGVTSIGEDAFSNCTKLTSVTLLDGLTSIEKTAFYKCKLTSITLPSSLTSIGENAFEASGLTSITVPGSVKTISGSMFNACTALTNVVLSEGVEEIQGHAFYNCSSLSTITIPTTLKSIEGTYNTSGGAFENCSNITTVVYNGNNGGLVEEIVGADKRPSVIKRQKDAPTNLTATAPDNSNQDNGKISGVSNTMEYKLEGADGWTTCMGTEITGLTAGTYKVREKEEDGYVAGLEATVVVPKKVVSYGGGGSSKQYPTVAETANGTITLSSNGRSATITPDAGYEIASVTVNGEDKGTVSTLTGLRTGDKIAATFQKTKETLDVEIKAAIASFSTMKARSSKNAKGNIKVVAKLSTAEKGKLTELTNLGYTVKYRFYRSTKKASSYKAMIEKDTATYINTYGKAGTRYYYKAQICVYDTDGTLVAKTELKNCKYATRKF